MEPSQPQAAAPSTTGKSAVVAMLIVGLLAAGFAWWWNYQRGRQALALFGSEGAALVRKAPRAVWLQSPPAEPVDFSTAPGLLNARTALLSDASYDWQAAPRLDSPLYTIRFSDGDKSVDVTFDFENRTLRASSTGRAAVLKTKTAEGWRGYLAKQVPGEQGTKK